MKEAIEVVANQAIEVISGLEVQKPWTYEELSEILRDMKRERDMKRAERWAEAQEAGKDGEKPDQGGRESRPDLVPQASAQAVQDSSTGTSAAKANQPTPKSRSEPVQQAPEQPVPRPSTESLSQTPGEAAPEPSTEADVTKVDGQNGDKKKKKKRRPKKKASNKVQSTADAANTKAPEVTKAVPKLGINQTSLPLISPAEAFVTTLYSGVVPAPPAPPITTTTTVTAPPPPPPATTPTPEPTKAPKHTYRIYQAIYTDNKPNSTAILHKALSRVNAKLAILNIAKDIAARPIRYVVVPGTTSTETSSKKPAVMGRTTRQIVHFRSDEMDQDEVFGFQAWVRERNEIVLGVWAAVEKGEEREKGKKGGGIEEDEDEEEDRKMEEVLRREREMTYAGEGEVMYESEWPKTE